ncbi:MAG TPA: type III pantothenate kinase [Bacteroidia bacterium]|nr:type III pantothenate kinase [Bacteroidia bacterium]
MARLILDIGNTRTKIAVFNDHHLIDNRFVKGDFTNELRKILHDHETFASCIVSNVVHSEEEIREALNFLDPSKIFFIRSGMLLPVKIVYKTPETLGNDRLANACGAWNLNKNKNSLVIDMGTCIKYDFVNSQGDYLGGSISPGLLMRYKALTRFTGQLPYFKPNEEFPELIGQSTEGSIRSGVEIGILEEIKGIVRRYKEVFDQTDIILTGGDHSKFADKLKSPIFVAPNLTLIGLNEILNCNDQ